MAETKPLSVITKTDFFAAALSRVRRPIIDRIREEVMVPPKKRVSLEELKKQCLSLAPPEVLVRAFVFTFGSQRKDWRVDLAFVDDAAAVAFCKREKVSTTLPAPLRERFIPDAEIRPFLVDGDRWGLPVEGAAGASSGQKTKAKEKKSARAAPPKS